MADDNSNDSEKPPETETGGAGGGGKNNDRVTDTGGGDEEDNDYVGYRHPPKRHRFRPGQSGNRRGRPSGARGMKAMLRKELGARVRITENGRPCSVSKIEVMIKRLTEKGAQGDVKAISKLIELAVQVFGMDDEPDRIEPLNAEEQAIIDAARERRAWLASLADSQMKDRVASNETDRSDERGKDPE